MINYILFVATLFTVVILLAGTYYQQPVLQTYQHAGFMFLGIILLHAAFIAYATFCFWALAKLSYYYLLRQCTRRIIRPTWYEKNIQTRLNNTAIFFLQNWSTK